MDSYRRLWTELTAKESFEIGERWRVAARIRRLNELGFDVEEYAIKTTQNGSTIQLQPKVVDAGHHQRRLLRLTGLDAQENQARRLLNDMDPSGRTTTRTWTRNTAPTCWVSQIFEPIVRSIPRDLSGKLEPAEAVHEVLEHRWYMSEKAGPARPAGGGRPVLRRQRYSATGGTRPPSCSIRTSRPLPRWTPQRPTKAESAQACCCPAILLKTATRKSDDGVKGRRSQVDNRKSAAKPAAEASEKNSSKS